MFGSSLGFKELFFWFIVWFYFNRLRLLLGLSLIRSLCKRFVWDAKLSRSMSCLKFLAAGVWSSNAESTSEMIEFESAGSLSVPLSSPDAGELSEPVYGLTCLAIKTTFASEDKDL